MLNKLGEKIGAMLIVAFWGFATAQMVMLALDLFSRQGWWFGFWAAVGSGACVGMGIRAIMFAVFGRSLRTTYRRRYVS